MLLDKALSFCTTYISFQKNVEKVLLSNPWTLFQPVCAITLYNHHNLLSAT